MRLNFSLIIISSIFFVNFSCLAGNIPRASDYNFVKNFEIKNIVVNKQRNEREIVIEIEYPAPDSLHSIEKPSFRFVPIRYNRRDEYCEGIIIRLDSSSPETGLVKHTATITLNTMDIFHIPNCDISIRGPSKYYLMNPWRGTIDSFEYSE
ncbi:MAG: hypothetical protein HQK52_12830 [Oligoflexia bacterium]|nr:hypothetical protein [Oligoflexia bacterium]